MMALTRRNLFRFMAAAPAAPVAAAILKALPPAPKVASYAWRQVAVPITVTGVAASGAAMSELITMTLRRRTKALADNVTAHTPLLTRLKQGGQHGR